MINLSSNLKISVITACLDSEKYLERTILSVLSQSYKNIEYIIIDGGSKDATLKIIDKYKGRISCVISEKDSGIYDAQNKGIKLATGDILCVLNSDDCFYNEYVVEDIVNFFQQNKVDFVYGNMLCSDLANSEIILKTYPRNLTKRFFLRGPLGHSATFFHRDCFSKAGYYDTHYKISADYEWYLRALFKYGLRTAYLNQIISVFHIGGKSSNPNLLLPEMRQVQKLYFNPLELFINRCINFIFYGDIFRIVAKLVFTKKGYNFLRNLNRKLAIRHLPDIREKIFGDKANDQNTI